MSITNTVEYSIFLPTSSSLTAAEKLCATILVDIDPFINQYIWQDEFFNLQPKLDGDLCLLHGKTHFGENIDDEWFIVFLLLKITEGHPDLVIRVWDEDGEFLLIEAADHLPNWLEPETSDNRVFLYHGDVHIVPKRISLPGDVKLDLKNLDLTSAFEAVRKHSSFTTASNEINAVIKRRTECYPSKTKTMQHRTNCFIPAALAAVLDEDPTVLSAGVSAFCSRLPEDLKCCRTFSHFRPGTRVLRQVTFTKVLYAQLVRSRFVPDKRSGFTRPQFHGLLTAKAFDLGMKLAHGFEILVSRVEATSPSPCMQSSHWDNFISNLKELNFFEGIVEGSKAYNDRVLIAQKFFSASTDSAGNKLPSMQTHGHYVKELLTKLNFDIESLRSQEKNLTAPDDDSWLDLTPSQLDDMLKVRTGVDPTKLERDSKQFNLTDVADSMKRFIESESSVDGVEFPLSTPGEHDDSRDSADFDDDPSKFMKKMQDMFDFDQDVLSTSDDSLDDYGASDSLDSDDEILGASKKGKTKAGKPAVSLKDIMKLTDAELLETAVGKSFERKEKKLEKSGAAEIDDFNNTVDIEKTVSKNVSASLNLQRGNPGPAGNIILSMKECQK